MAMLGTRPAAGAAAGEESGWACGKTATVPAGGAVSAESGGGSTGTTRAAAAVPCFGAMCTGAAAAGLAVAEL